VGDFDEVERLQGGIRSWLLRSARSGRHELRGLGATAVLPLLCAAAFGPALADDVAPAVAGMGVLASVDAAVLARVLGEAADQARSVSSGPAADLARSLELQISRSVGEVLAGHDQQAGDLRSDLAMVMREIDAGGTALRAAIEAGDEEFQREVLAAFEALAAEFGDLAFMLGDLARAAGEVQDSLGGHGAELRAAGEQVGRQSADVRMIREELAVIEQRTRQWQPQPAGGPGAGPGWTGSSPYRGLLPYDQAHQAVFCGRERLTAELAGMVAGTGIVMVTGASGAGKTSLLQAGLVPALARGVQVPGSPTWPVVSLTATARPLTGLAAGLAALAGGDPAAIRERLARAPGQAHLVFREITWRAGEAARLVLIIDQFERVFAADGPEERQERTAFIDAVCAATGQPAGPRGEPPARVVIAVRGDYWDRCGAYPQLVPAMERAQLVVGPMPEAGLRHVVTGPARAAGLRAGSALTDAVVTDARTAGTGPVLPMLSQALLLTWENREGDELTRAGYERSGRLAGAVEAGAEAVYAGLAEGQRTIARDLLRRMTAVSQDGQAARRAVTRDELGAAYPARERAEAGAVLDALAEGRLVVFSGGSGGRPPGASRAAGDGAAEIAHDVLLRAWPRLRDWLEEDQASLILYGQLAEDTARWQQDGRNSARLYRGVQLAAALQAARVWAADPGRYPALVPAEAEFLRASGRAATQGRWWRQTLAGAVVVLVVAALAGAGLAVRSARNSASQERTAGLSVRLAAQSTVLEASDPVTAALLAGAAWRIAPTAQARYGLLESAAQPLRGTLAARAGVVTAMAYSPGGQTLAAGYRDGTIRLWDAASRRLLSTATWDGAPLAVAFTGGGKTLEVAGPAAVGAWNLASHAAIAARPLPGLAGGRAAAFSRDGTTLATGGGDGNVRLWRVASRDEIGAPMSSVLNPVEAVTFSPDGATVAAASSDGAVQLWDVATQQEAGTTMAAGSAAVGALAFGPDGKFLAAGGDDGDVRFWDVTAHTQAGTTMTTGAPVAALSFNARGTTLASAASNGGTQLWSVATHRQTGAVLGSGRVGALAYSPGAGILAAGGGDGTIELWDPALFHQASAPVGVGGPGASAAGRRAPVAFAARGDALAVSDGRGTVRLRDARTGRSARPPVVTGHAVTGLALSPDGATLAVTSGGGLQLWSTATGRRIGGPLPAAGPVAFSPDGRLVAAVGPDGKARRWQVATRRPAGTAVAVGSGAGRGALALGPGGTTLAVADGGRVRLWDLTTRQETGAPVAAGSGRVYAVAFSPDGHMLAIASGDGNVRLWDVTTQQQVGAPMSAGSGPVYAVAFSPDGGTLATASGDGNVRRWGVAFPAGLLAAACTIAGHSLTREQWADYAGGQPFQQVCPAS
jgi:WD40 repeat protein